MVKISAIKKGDYVLIEIIDNGMGIAREKQKRIFERFFQVDKSRKGGEGCGIGLGLAKSMQIVWHVKGKFGWKVMVKGGVLLW